ncbi:MAG TPA: alpha/beta hydrolase [Solimonas sp.]|nr:alpha/beta hydrolase [Solimonas sp.]
MPHVTLRDGAQMHYWDIGRGPTCVLLHGFGMHAWMWLPNILPLATRHRFILPDLRGFGGSHRLPIRKENALEQHADDLEDLLVALKLDNPALAGLSMGACTALEYQRRYGFDRVAGYLNIDNPPCVTGKAGWPWGLFGERHLGFRSDMRSLIADLGEHAPYTPFGELPKKLRGRMWNMLAEFGVAAVENRALQAAFSLGRFEPLISRLAGTEQWRVYTDIMRTYAEIDHDWRDSVGRTQGKLFRVFAGTHSRMYPIEGQMAFARYVPDVEIVRFEGAGHCVQFDAPAQFTRELGRFLRDVRSRPQQLAVEPQRRRA